LGPFSVQVQPEKKKGGKKRRREGPEKNKPVPDLLPVSLIDIRRKRRGGKKKI